MVNQYLRQLVLTVTWGFLASRSASLGGGFVVKGLPGNQLLAMLATVPNNRQTPQKDIPKPTGIEQHNRDMSPDTMAYGSWVRTCSAYHILYPHSIEQWCRRLRAMFSQVAPLSTAVTAKIISTLAQTVPQRKS